MPTLWACLYRNDADQRLLVLLSVCRLRHVTPAEGGRLLRVLLVWNRTMPAAEERISRILLLMDRHVSDR